MTVQGRDIDTPAHEREPEAGRATKVWRRLLLASAVASAIVWMIPCAIIPLVGPPRLNSAYLAAVTWIGEILAPFKPLYAMIFNRSPIIYSAHDTLAIQIAAWSPYALFSTVMWFVATLAISKFVMSLRRVVSR